VDQQGHPEKLEKWDLQDQVAPQVPLVPVENEGLAVQMDQLDLLDHLAQEDLGDQVDNLAKLDQLEKLDHRVMLEALETGAQEVHLAHQVLLELLEQLDL